MNVYRTMVSIIFCLMGILVFIKGIKVTRKEGIKNSYVDLATGVGFVFIGMLIWLRYIS